MTKKIIIFIAVLAVLVIAVIYFSAVNVEAPKTTIEDKDFDKETEVVIANFSFVPEIITISKGTTVKWRNQDVVIHTVNSNLFDSPFLQNGESFDFLFSESGVYNYTCDLHAGMEGTVIVE